MIQRLPHYGQDLHNKNWENIIKNVWKTVNELVDAVNRLEEQEKHPLVNLCPSLGQWGTHPTDEDIETELNNYDVTRNQVATIARLRRLFQGKEDTTL